MTSLTEATKKLEHYCAYQERCHKEVIAKLRDMKVDPDASDSIIVHLINHNFLNEERFACSFARGKHRIKKWGRNRIVNELRARDISTYNITTALKEISPEEYEQTFHELAEKHWESLGGRNSMLKRKTFCDFLLRKGFETDIIYEKAKSLETGR
ncbi:MAG: RecX family transcriptional regulator [Flavobacterium sp.]|nr:MAG: RecX family transcriptional regulator [Flavobacterium sp.]